MNRGEGITPSLFIQGTAQVLPRAHSLPKMYIRSLPFTTHNNGGVHTGMPNRLRIGLKPIRHVHTEIGLAQTDLDPTHLTM